MKKITIKLNNKRKRSGIKRNKVPKNTNGRNENFTWKRKSNSHKKLDF